ncbi:MAG: TonB-dependent receptor [Bacteroidota bacterium]
MISYSTTLKNVLFVLLFLSVSTLLAQKTINGTVKSSDGDALVGATVIISGTSVGALTDGDGAFSITLPDGDQMLNVSYLGFATQSVAVSSGYDPSVALDVSLSPDKLSLDAVVVTGTFGSRSQKESPLSMTYLNARQLQNLSANSQADILRTIPGITAEGGGGEVASNVFVRGLPSGGQYQFTPLQVDGLPVLSTFGLNSSAHDVYFRNDIGIRNLEFVRGGASTLFGAGSVAGIINYTSYSGSITPENKIQLEWAEGGRAKMDFLSAGPINENTFYAVSGFYRYDEGPLETGLPTQGYQIRGNIKRLFNEGQSSFTVYGQFIDDNVQFYLPYPLDNQSGDRERPTGNDGEEVFTMLTSQAKDFSFDTPNGRFESPIGNGVTTKGSYIMLDLKHAFGDNWTLASKAKVANYDHWFNLFLDGDGVHNTPEPQASYLLDRNLPADAAFSYVDTGLPLGGSDLLFENRILDRQRPMNEMVGEINLTRNFGAHQITLGTFVSDTRAEDNNWIWNFVGDFSNSPRAVEVSYTDANGEAVTFSPGGYVDGSGRQTSNRYHESYKTAFYLADEFKGEKFNFDIGLRWEKARGIISRETGIGSNTFEKGTVEADDIAVALAGLYKVSRNTNIYANFSRGYFFPELRGVRFSSPGETQTYETEGITQGELGIKYGSSKFSITAAAFLVALSDRRSVDFVNDGRGGVIEEVALQSTRTIGVEANANLNLAKGLDLYGNFTYQDPQFTKVEGNPEQEGNTPRRQPNTMGLIGLSYENSGFDFDFSSNFFGSKFANDANSVELEGYNIARANIGYRFILDSDNSMRIGLSAFNLFDSAGITEGSPRQGNSQVSGGQFFVGRPILPRRIFVRVSFDF